VLLGATRPDGLPAELFSNGEARWVGAAVDGQAEQERVQLVSVPYAVEAHDVDTVGGLPPSAFLLASPSALHDAKPEGAPDIVPDTACAGISSDGTATANQVGKFTGPCTVEPSAIFESGGKVGIGTNTPAATLDVDGTAALRGALTMNATGAASAAAGAASNPFDLLAASFNSSTGKSINQHFRWQAEAAGNDTSNPSGTLNLLYAAGSGTPAETGLLVNSHGLFTFGAGQTFPGAGTITNVTVGAGITGGGATGAVGVGLTTACAGGQALAWNGSSWACSAISPGTVTAVTAGAGLSGGGTGGNVTLTNTGVLGVAAGTGITSSGGNAPTIGLNTGFTDARYLQLAGGALSGALNLPANGLTAAGNQLVLAGGNVGVRTAAPGAPLQVAGSVKISGAASALTFPDGTAQATAASPPAVGGNPLNLALLKWFPAYQSANFGLGCEGVGYGIAFDGANIWASCDPTGVVKLSASTGALLGTFPVNGAVTLLFDGADIWVGTYFGLTKLSAATGAVLGTVTLPDGWGAMAFDGTYIWITDNTANTVIKLQASNGTVAGTYPVGSDPVAIAFDGVNIWVANQVSNNVTKLLASSGAPLGTYGVGSSPQGIAFDGANIWVTNFGSNNVTKLLASSGATVGTYHVGNNPYGIAFDGANIWVTNYGSDNVLKLLAADGALLGNFNVQLWPTLAAFDGANMWVLNLNSNSVSKL
jgi:hypothetical protein